MRTKPPLLDKYGFLWWPVEIGRGEHWKPLASVKAETAQEACCILRTLLKPDRLLRIAR